MKRTASHEYKNAYSSVLENYTLDKTSEEKAYRIVINKMLRDLEDNKKRNH